MRVLITGSQGKIGKVVTEMVAAAGQEVVSFDQASAGRLPWEHIPGDVQDELQTRRAMMGCDAVAHLAAIPGDDHRRRDQVFNTNVRGTWNVLRAASEAGAKKVIFMSSIQSLGFGGRPRKPDYLPIDDAHPHYVRPVYQLSKHVGEEMCAAFSEDYDMSTYCLRPTHVANGDDYNRWRDAASTNRRGSFTNVYSYVDIRDVARAVLCCLDEGRDVKHGCYLLSAADNTQGVPTAELLQEHWPDVPWKGASLEPGSLRSLLDTSAARQDLGWEPLYSWKG